MFPAARILQLQHQEFCNLDRSTELRHAIGQYFLGHKNYCVNNIYSNHIN